MEIADDRMPYNMSIVSFFNLRNELFAILNRYTLDKFKFWDGYTELSVNAIEAIPNIPESEINILQSIALDSTNSTSDKIKAIFDAAYSPNGATIVGEDKDGKPQLVMPELAHQYLMTFLKVSEK
jgi:hypothetical protein